MLVLWKASVTSNEELCGQSHQHVLKLPIGCVIGQKNLFAKNLALRCTAIFTAIYRNFPQFCRNFAAIFSGLGDRNSPPPPPQTNNGSLVPEDPRVSSPNDPQQQPGHIHDKHYTVTNQPSWKPPLPPTTQPPYGNPGFPVLPRTVARTVGSQNRNTEIGDIRHPFVPHSCLPVCC